MRIDTGVKRTFEGITEKVFIEGYDAKYPYPHRCVKICGYPTKASKKTSAYRGIRDQLGDDFVSDLTDIWWQEGVLPSEAFSIITDLIRLA